jgi:WXG100 family type VII secretion target
MADRVKVEPEHLFVSAVEVDGHAEDVLVGHAEAHGQIEGAQSGWTGLSATALAAKVAKWHEATVALGSRVAGHAEGLRNSGFGFSAMEEQNAELLRNLAPESGSSPQ